ncbi:unnamed protein product [Amaranthus hypochondriacus]
MAIQTINFFHFILLLTPFLPTISSTKTTSNHLPRGSSIPVEHASSKLLFSLDKTFTCGFYTIDNTTNAYFFSIWYTNTKDKTVIWTANRDKPVNGRGSELSFRKDGAMVLTDFDGSSVWETNTSSTEVSRAELLNSGNFVLKDSNGKILWQSFDFPTDTLLPNQYFTKNTRLISRVSSQKFDSGYFNFFFDNDNVLKLMYNGPEISSLYWPKPDNNVFQEGRTSYNSTLIAVFDDMGSFISSDYLQFNTSDRGILGIKRRLTMDYDGNLRIYSLNDLSGLWVITWEAIAKPCHIHGLCGRNGICLYTPKPTCSCPPYYEHVDSKDWSKGCKPKFDSNCSDSEFLELPYVDYFGFDINTTYAPISFEDCRQRCLRDCRCQAFKHAMSVGLWNCYTKSALFNGYRFQGSIHIRIPKGIHKLESKTSPSVSSLDCGNGKPKIELVSKSYNFANKQTFKWVYVYSFGVAIGAIEVAILIASWYFLFRKQGFSNSLEEGYRTLSSQFRSFSYNELKTSTNKFKQVLGKGGFGAVYKGVLGDGRVIAAKNLENMVQGEEEFWAEVSTIGRINHMNLARMWGFCSEKKHKLLVYEYIENGSLDKHLFLSSSTSNSTVLGWDTRFKIALGIAKGLAYLHHECLEWVIHCDVKPENILLDRDFEPKISDFGLAKLCQRDDHGLLSELSRIRGTKGYMAPEWTTNLPLTAKVDVYSYGVVILELVLGIRLSSVKVEGDHLEEEEISRFTKFVIFAKGKMQEGDDLWMEDLVDPRLEGEFSRNQAVKMMEIGLSCVEDDRNKRPTMESIVQILVECEDETT